MLVQLCSTGRAYEGCRRKPTRTLDFDGRGYCCRLCQQQPPVTFDSALMLSAAMVMGLLCAVNAVLDIDEMGVVETYVAVLWLIALVIMTALTLYPVASIREFASK